MSTPLQYTQLPQMRPRLPLATAIVTLLAISCFATPFPLFYLSHRFLYPGNAEAAGFAVLPFAAILWILSGLSGLAGIVLGILCLIRRGFRLWVLLAVLLSSIPPAVILYFLLKPYFPAPETPTYGTSHFL